MGNPPPDDTPAAVSWADHEAGRLSDAELRLAAAAELGDRWTPALALAAARQAEAEEEQAGDTHRHSVPPAPAAARQAEAEEEQAGDAHRHPVATCASPPVHGVRHAELCVDGVAMSVVLDSGSETNVVTAAWAHSRGLDIRPVAAPTLTGVGDTITVAVGAVTFTIDWAGSIMMVDAVVVGRLPYPVLLGTPALYHSGVRHVERADGRGQARVRYGTGGWVPTSTARLGVGPLPNVHVLVLISEDEAIEVEAVMEAEALAASAEDPESMAADLAASWSWPPSAFPGATPNMAAGPPALDVAAVNAREARTADPDAWKRVRINPGLPRRTRRALEEVLRHHSDRFTEERVPPLLHGVVHRIVLREGADLASANMGTRRFDPEKTAAIAKMVAELDAKGRTVDVESPVSAAPVVVPKRDEDGQVTGWRVCVDFRALNAISVADGYPMPTVAEVLSVAQGEGGGTQWLRSKLDVKSCFHAIPLDQDSVILTNTKFGQGLRRSFLVSPFGLVGLPATLQRAMDETFSTARRRAYMDDLLQRSTQATLVADIDDLLSRASTINMCFSPEKCMLGYEQVSALGFDIGPGDERRPSEAKTALLREFPLPSSLAGVRRFVAMVRHYSGHVPTFECLAKTLEKVKRGEGKALAWEPHHVSAFLRLKDLVADRVATHPLGNGRLRLTTDFSGVAFGWVLEEEEEGHTGVWRIVALGSQRTSKFEANYSPMEGELAAVRAALLKLDHLGLRARRILWVTDSKPGTSLATTNPQSNQRIRRTAMELAKYDLSPLYIKGADNVVADWASRPEGPDLVPQVWLDHLATLTAATGHDPVEMEDMEECPVPIPVTPVALEEKGKDRQVLLLEEANAAIDTPVAARAGVLQRLHDGEGEVSAHRSPAAMAHLAGGRVSWPSMQADMVAHVQACVTCQLASRAPRRRDGGVLAHVQQKGEVIFADLKQVGKTVFLTALDEATGFLMARALTAKSAREVAAVFEDVVLSIFPAIGTVRTDPGKEFAGEFADMLDRRGIQHRTTPPAQHDSTGALDVTHRELEARTRRFVAAAPGSAPEDHVVSAVREWNWSVGRTRGVAPVEALTGVRPPTGAVAVAVRPRPVDPTVNVAQATSLVTAPSLAESRERRDAVGRRERRRGAPQLKWAVGDAARRYRPGVLKSSSESRWFGPFIVTHVHEGGRAVDLRLADAGEADTWANETKVSVDHVQRWGGQAGAQHIEGVPCLAPPGMVRSRDAAAKRAEKAARQAQEGLARTQRRALEAARLAETQAERKLAALPPAGQRDRSQRVMGRTYKDALLAASAIRHTLE